MKYVQINAFSNSWAEQIVFRKHRELLAAGNESWVFWGKGRPSSGANERRIQSPLGYYADAFQTKILDGKIGFHSKSSTRRLLAELDGIDPDVVHLHSLIGYYVNIEMLFGWLRTHRCKVLWTLHDCWAFTGHCLHFSYVKCNQWKNHCGLNEPCPQPDAYIKTRKHGMEAWSFENKRRLFTSLPSDRMKIITPSRWLAGLVKQSYLSKYEVEVRHNQIDTSVFKPTQSDFRERYGLHNRFVILGVASRWTERKGLSDFIQLAFRLDSVNYSIVMVGLTAKDVQHVLKTLESHATGVKKPKSSGAKTDDDALNHCPPMDEDRVNLSRDGQAVSIDMSSLRATIVDLVGGSRVVLIEKTDSIDQLAAIYTTADVLFNPTREDNYPTVNLEAQACGTPVYTYDTGGCAETITLHGSRVLSGVDEFVAILADEGFKQDAGIGE